MKKYTSNQLREMDIREVYELILDGKYVKRFPNGTWKGEDSLENAKILIKYLIEDKLKIKKEDLASSISKKTFYDNKLCGMLGNLFNDSPYNAINLIYPNEINPWEFNMCPMNFWNEEDNCILAIKWLIETKLKWDDNKVLSSLNNQTFIDNNLGGLLSKYNYSTYSLYNLAYPNKYYPWQFKQTPNVYWESKENVDLALDWLFNERLKWSDDEIKEKFNTDIIMDNNLFGLLKIHFKGSPYELLNYYYPNKFNAWELKQTPKRYWSEKENRKKAIYWLIDKENISKDKISRELLAKNGLTTLTGYYKGSMQRLKEDIF